LGPASLATVLAQGALLHGLAYPFLTAQRRMEAQSPNKAGLLHPRYSNYLHCFAQTHKEEGLKGLYRGFPPYLLATVIALTVIPVMAEELLQRSPLMRSKGKDTASENDALYDEVMEGKKRVEEIRTETKKQEREARERAATK